MRLLEKLNVFEKSLYGYATDPYYGNLTVNPKNLGTALNISCEMALKPTK